MSRAVPASASLALVALALSPGEGSNAVSKVAEGSVSKVAEGSVTKVAGSSEASGTALESAAEPVVQIHAREVWTSAGERIKDGLLVVSGGRVRSVGTARDIDRGQALIEHDGIVTAGLVACRVEGVAGDEIQDDTRSVLSEGRAAYAVDPESSDLSRALAAGITALGLAPGWGNLVGGLACVVKTDGRVLVPEAGLALSLASFSLGRSTAQGGFFFGVSEDGEYGDNGEYDAELTGPDGGPETTANTPRGTREPTSYAGAVAMLDQLLGRREGPFARAARGELPVTILAGERHEVLRAAQFAKKHELRGAIRGAWLGGDPDVVAALRASGLGVIVGPYSAQQTQPSLASVRLLSEAGIPVAFGLNVVTGSPEDLRLSAARALRAGAKREAVWKALTEDGALLSGAGEKIGKLAPGQEADFVLWSGDPLDLSSRVVAVYVDGKQAWCARTER